MWREIKKNILEDNDLKKLISNKILIIKIIKAINKKEIATSVFIALIFLFKFSGSLKKLIKA